GLRVTRVLVEEHLSIAREFYAAMLLDRSTGTDLAMVAVEGGVDIEELARTRPETIRRLHIDPEIGLHPYHLRRLTGSFPPEVRDLVENVLTGEDATLVEVNPLVLLSDGRVLALDAKVTIDDNALWRRREIEMLKSSF